MAASNDPFRLIVDGSTATAALSQPAISATFPTAATRTSGWGAARFRMGGTDAENETFDYQVVLWTKFLSSLGECYVPMVVASGTATLGTLAYGAGTAIGATGNLFADTLDDDLGYRGVYVTSPAGDSIAELEIDIRNADGIEVQIDVVTAASADVLLQLAE